MAGTSMKRSAHASDAKANNTNTHKRQRAGEWDAETPLQLRLACPFHRREPHVYCATRASKYFKTCASGGFKDTHRVKEHIQRNHQALSQCHRCGAIFSTDEKLKSHQRVKQSCPRIESLPHFVTITPEQLEQLTRKTRTNKTEEEKWNTIYATLFPNEPIPSAFDLTPEESAQAIRANESFQLEGYAKQRLHYFIDGALQAAFNGSPPTSPDAARFLHLLPAAIEQGIAQLLAEYRTATSMLPDMSTPATSAVTPPSSAPRTSIATVGGSNNSTSPNCLRASEAKTAAPSSSDSELDPNASTLNSPLLTFEEFNHRMQGMESLGAGVASQFPSTIESSAEFDVFSWLDETALNLHCQ